MYLVAVQPCMEKKSIEKTIRKDGVQGRLI